MTYKQLLAEVCKFANVLKKYGVRKGDSVAIYLPMVPEAAIAMLACARIGAVHSVSIDLPWCFIGQLAFTKRAVNSL